MTARRPTANAPRIAIIGAGLAGACAAFALHKRGARITVFERDRVASGASGAAAGMLQPLTGMRLSYTTENIRNFEYSRTLIARLLVAGDTWRPLGVLRLVRDEKQEALWRRRIEKIPQDLAQWKDVDALRQLEPRLCQNMRAGVFLPDACMVDVPAFIHALLDASSATVLEGARAQHIEKTAAGLALRVEGQETPEIFDHIVIASGAQAPQPIADPSVDMRPHMGIMAAFEGFEPPSVAINYRGYITGWRDNSVLVGTVNRHAGFEKEPTQKTLDALRAHLHSVLRVSETPRLTKVWKGIRPTLPDRTPIARRSSSFERVWIFTGFGGRGLTVGPRMAESLAQEITDA